MKNNLHNIAGLLFPTLGISIDRFIQTATPIVTFLSLIAGLGVAITAIVFNIIRTKKLKKNG